MNLKRAKQLRDSGLPWHEVARRLNTTLAKLRHAWASSEYPPDTRYHTKKRKPTVTPKMIEKANELRAAGTRWKLIGKQLRIAWKYLYDACRKQRATSSKPPEIVRKAVELRAQGNRWKAIARALDTDTVKLCSMVRYYTVTTRQADE